MSTDSRFVRKERVGAAWDAAWPSCLLVIFAGLALVHFLSPGYARSIVAIPVLLSVPGALTLGVLLTRSQVDRIFFSCIAALLSVLWLAFASLALYVLHVLITAKSTYWCLLLVCAVLAVMAQLRRARMMAPSDRADVGIGARNHARRFDVANTGISVVDSDGLGGFRDVRYALAALAAGVALLGGGAYFYTHSSHSAPAGYTWIAWAGKPANGVIPVSPSGGTLPFQIEHQQASTAAFLLTAVWTGSGRQHSLATPVALHIGPDKMIQGKLAIPVPPGGCTYRIVVTLTEVGPANPRSWSINADVRRRAPGQNVCAS